jgi:hypothetical protein
MVHCVSVLTALTTSQAVPFLDVAIIIPTFSVPLFVAIWCVVVFLLSFLVLLKSLFRSSHWAEEVNSKQPTIAVRLFHHFLGIFGIFVGIFASIFFPLTVHFAHRCVSMSQSQFNSIAERTRSHSYTATEVPGKCMHIDKCCCHMLHFVTVDLADKVTLLQLPAAVSVPTVPDSGKNSGYPYS